MLRNWANYLLGSVLPEDGTTATGVADAANLRLTSLDHEGDWILVDKDVDDDKSDVCSVTSLEDECLDGPILLQPIIRTRTSSTSSLPCSSNMEESWFLTPPPCFTSTGPICMTTSPLENLLIEHPSMSVYHIHQRRYLAGSRVSSTASQCGEDDAEQQEVVVVEDRGDTTPTVVVRRASRDHNELQALEHQQKQILLSRKAQKAQAQKAGQTVKRGQLERNNKARELNGRNRRQRRGERSQGATRSRVNNNRKC